MVKLELQECHGDIKARFKCRTYLAIHRDLHVIMIDTTHVFPPLRHHILGRPSERPISVSSL
jgi:hypothetical protein